MDKETFLSKIAEIGSCDDDVQRRTLLEEMSEGVSQIYDSSDEQTKTIEDLKTSIENEKQMTDRLREENNKLFLRVSSQRTDEERKKASTGIEEPEEHKRKFEDLFNEKGMIK